MEARRVMYEFQNRTTQYPELRCVMKVAMHFPSSNRVRCCSGARVAAWFCLLVGLSSTAMHAQNVVGEWTSHVPTNAFGKLCLPETKSWHARIMHCSRWTPLRLK